MVSLRECLFSLPFRLLLCLAAIGFTLWLDIDHQNHLNALRMQLPILQRDVREIQEHNTRLGYEIAQFENPLLLMEMARKPEFSHLRYPTETEVIIITVPEDRP